MSDRYRPADYQVNKIYQCDRCGGEIEQVSIYGVGPCDCGGRLIECGESYPADSQDWDEERRDGGEWERRR